AAAGEWNAERERRVAARRGVGREIGEAKLKAARNREEAAELRAKADELDQVAGELEAQVASLERQIETAPPLPAPVDNAPILAKLAAARDTNRYIRER